MIHKLISGDASAAMDFLGKESAFNLFIIGDIENFGTCGSRLIKRIHTPHPDVPETQAFVDAAGRRVRIEKARLFSLRQEVLAEPGDTGGSQTSPVDPNTFMEGVRK